MADTVSVDDLRFLYREADSKFQQHRGACSDCRYNPRRPKTMLCGTGRGLFETAENLRQNLEEAEKEEVGA